MFKKKYKAQVLAIVVVILFIGTIIAISMQSRRQSSITTTIASRASVEAEEVMDSLLDKLTMTSLSTVMNLFKEKNRLEEDKSTDKHEITDFLKELGIDDPFDNSSTCSLDIDGNKYVLSLSKSNDDSVYEISPGQSWALPINNGFNKNSKCTLNLNIKKVDNNASFRVYKTYAMYDQNGRFLGYKEYDYGDALNYCMSDDGATCINSSKLFPVENWIKYVEDDTSLTYLLTETLPGENGEPEYQLDDINVKAINGRIGISYTMTDDGNDCSAGYGIQKIVLEAYCNGTYSGKEIMIPERDWYDSIFDYTLFNGSGQLGADMSVVDTRNDNPIEVIGKTLYYTGKNQNLVTVSKEENCDELYFSTDTDLTSTNYTSGIKTIPVGKDVGTYDVYYYCTGNSKYKRKAGKVSVEIIDHSIYACNPGILLSRCLILSDYPDEDYIDETDLYNKSIENIERKLVNFNDTSSSDDGLNAGSDYSSASSTILDGTTYYYRGDVPDNWVVYAGYLWRVVRINGDGSIRLIYSGTKEKHVSGEDVMVKKSEFNRERGDDKFLGYMYDTNKNSTVKEAIDDWYANNISGKYEGYLSNEIFCNDMVSTGYRWGTTLYFDRYNTPSLSCAKDNSFTLKVSGRSSIAGIQDYGNNALDYPVGLITADEVIMAGIKESQNDHHYLYTGGNAFWTETPVSLYSFMFTRIASEMYVINGSIAGNDVSDNNVGVRPVLNLNRDIIYVEGNGLVDNPFVVGLPNPITVSGKHLTYSGGEQILVTTVNNQGNVYYSLNTPLNNENYKTDGSTTLPTALNAGVYTVYWYCEGVIPADPFSGPAYVAESGEVEASIEKVNTSLSINPRSVSSLYTNDTGTFAATVSSSSVNCPGILSAVSNNSAIVDIISDPNKGVTATSTGQNVSFTYQGVGVSNTGTYILVSFTPEDTVNFNAPGPQRFVVRRVDEIIKEQNTVTVSGKYLSYTGNAQVLASVSDAQGSVYYSMNTQLNGNNYRTAGSTTIPSATNSGNYTIYWYCEGNDTYAAASGQVESTINKIITSLSISPTSVSSLTINKTGSFSATVTSSINCPGTIVAASTNTSSVSIINGDSKSATATSSGQGVQFTYQGVGVSSVSTEIVITFTPNDRVNFVAPAQQVFTVNKVEEVIKQNNPITVTGKTVSYNGNSYSLVTTSNAQGSVYYSTSTKLDGNNYRNTGSTTIPSAVNAGNYTIYWYCEGNDLYNAASGQASTTINKITPTLSLNSTSIASLTVDSTGTFSATVKSSINCSGTLKATSGNNNIVSITSGASSSVTATSAGQSKTITYKGASASNNAISITVSFTPSDTTNFAVPASRVFTVSKVVKLDNPVTVTGKSLQYTGSAQVLVTTSNAQGSVYYSTSTSLNSGNYTSGSTTIPTQTDSGNYTIYWYCVGNNVYKAKSGSANTSIEAVAAVLSAPSVVKTASNCWAGNVPCLVSFNVSLSSSASSCSGTLTGTATGVRFLQSKRETGTTTKSVSISAGGRASLQTGAVCGQSGTIILNFTPDASSSCGAANPVSVSIQYGGSNCMYSI